MWQQLFQHISEGNIKALARAISLVENEYMGYEELLELLPNTNTTTTIGITGPPGAGKSTLVDAMIDVLVKTGKKVAILCVDPSSPFNMGALLGDRIRMSEWYTNPNVFIRSLASRGSLGGLHPKILEIVDILKASIFDYIIIETVGVGQSEIEIAGLADTCVVVLVPESGDEIQAMKAGLMEIADIFVVNKAERPGADIFIKNLRQMIAPVSHKGITEIPIIKTIALKRIGLVELIEKINQHQLLTYQSDRKYWLLAEKCYRIIQENKMAAINKNELFTEIRSANEKPGFNLYSFSKKYAGQRNQ
jgi:LAO/AO transport system kinase